MPVSPFNVSDLPSNAPVTALEEPAHDSTDEASTRVSHVTQPSIVPLDSAEKASRRTTGIKIDKLCKKFHTLSLAEQRSEWAARSGTERERLRPLATGIWFWQSGMTSSVLAENLKSLVQQFTALPELPADLDRASMAQTCATACATLKPEAAQWQPLERALLEDLITACADEFDPTRMTSMREKQKKNLAEAKKILHFSRQVESVRKGLGEYLPGHDAQVEFDQPWRTACAEMLSSYPSNNGWTPAATAKNMSNLGLQQLKGRMDGSVGTAAYLCSRIPASYPSAFSEIKLISAAQRAFSAFMSQLEENSRERATELKNILQKHRSDKNSLRAINHLCNCGIKDLGSLINATNRYRPLGVADCFQQITVKASQGKLSAEERKKFIDDLTRVAPQAVQLEFIPRLTAWRDFHQMYSRMQDELLPGARAEKLDIDEMFKYPGHGLRDFLVLERCIGEGALYDDVVGKISKSKFQESTQEISSLSLTLAHGSDHLEASTFLSDFRQLLSFTRFQNEAISRLGAVASTRTIKLTSREAVAKLHNNLALAMRAFREMGTTYAYFRQLAGEPSAPDAVMGTLARCALMAEAGAYFCKNLEPLTSSSGGGPGTPPKVAPMEESGWLPQEIELPAAQATAFPALEKVQVSDADEPAAPVPASLSERLIKARDHAHMGNTTFAGIALSSSQQTNPFRASEAKRLYQEAHTRLKALHTELEGMRPEQRPGGTKNLDPLRKEVIQVGLAVEIMKNLAGDQFKMLFWPTANHAMENLFAKRKNFSARLPEKFLHEFPHTDPTSGVRTIDKMIEVDIDLLAHATKDGQFRSMVVQTVVLHCHYRTSLKLKTRADLLQVTESDFRDVHIKPGIYRIPTQKKAPRLLTETGQESTQTVDIPYGVVPKGIALDYIKLAANAKN